MFRGWGGFVYRFRWAVLVVSLLAVVASAIAITRFSTALSSNDNGGTYLESLRALSVMRDELPSQQGSSFQIIFAAKDPNLKAADPAFVQAVDAALAPLRSDARVSAITTSPNFVSTDGRRTFAIVTMPAEYDVAKDQYPDLRAKVQSASLTTISTGYIPINEDFNRILDHDLQRAEVVGLPLSLVVLIIVFGGVLWRLLRRSSLRTAGLALLLTFGSLGLALIPVLIGLFTLAGGVAGIYALAHSRDMSVYGLNIASMIGLGVSIDYSLFIISRFLEEVPRRSVRDAIVRTIETTGKAITFSGLTVAIGVAGLLFYRSPMLQSMGLAAILVVVTAVFYGLTFLPALLAVTGNGIAARASRRAAQPAEQAPARATRAATGGGLWHRVAGGVMSHPWLTLLPLLALLLLAGSPFLRLRLSPTDVNALPAGTESREGWALLTQEFPGSENTSVTVVVRYPDGQPLGAAHVGQLYDYGRWLAGLPDVARVKSVVTPPGPDGKPLPKEAVVALYAAPQATWPQELQTQVHNTVGAHLVTLSVLTPLDPHSDAARDLVRRIRAGGPANPGGEVLVTGETALNIDQIASIKADTVPAAAFIMGATYVVLFLLLGSVLLPLKAVLMNLLSISASYGALVWIFQDGHLSNLLGFTPAGIDPLIPVLMFCILFGLSMDYEVLLLSRMKEEYDRTGDNRHAVLEGLEQTGRLITGAAAIMVFVFGGFGMAQITLIKSIGVGMALAVTVDALLVRTLIIPATMRLLGDLNWWAPAPLARLYRRLGLAEQSGDHGATPAVAVAGAGTTGEPERELVGAGRVTGLAPPAPPLRDVRHRRNRSDGTLIGQLASRSAWRPSGERPPAPRRADGAARRHGRHRAGSERSDSPPRHNLAPGTGGVAGAPSRAAIVLPHFAAILAGEASAQRCAPERRGRSMESGTVRGGVIGGVILTTLGVLFLVQPFTGINLWAFVWPYFVIVPGLLFLLVAVLAREHAPGLAIPGTILTTLGLILFYQNAFSYFQSWAYAWTLVCPTAIGLGLVAHARLTGGRRLARVGQSLAGAGLALFLLLATCFEVGVFHHGAVIRFGLPLLLIVAGLAVSIGSVARGHTRQLWLER